MPHDSITSPKEPLRKANPKERTPHLFGRGGRDRVLTCLAANGPTRVREIARMIGVGAGDVFAIIERLREQGVVVKRTPPQHEYGAYVALNRASPIYPVLKTLLLTIARHWPVAGAKRKQLGRHMPYEPTMPDAIFDMFCAPIRSRVLLLIAAVERADLATISQVLNVSYVAAHHAVARWEKEGVLRSQRVGAHRILSLDPDFEVAPELRALLLALVKRHPCFRKLRIAARRKAQRANRRAR
jgi:transposase